ncbi:conserved hypothetical protein [Uncinocarpus reesii 1704]|uniref:Gfo/Idh/MocA-like oxidoreductase N-terminal domain-containing protein n=1 Tax=Uncinocarpus reesii (strain UAMH 1704) TaxID=336963 RepID=C4JZ02_UNCRE|nr:uncharacterized protein UREG_07403 [Uncinocarpus reesii 1704]EEP82538.1 conserved hypothetical protein [Uncinocarpus reesii 1704]
MVSVDSRPPRPNTPRAPGTLRFLVIGAGSRGNAYARAVTNATETVIHAVAEPDPHRRAVFGKKYIWGTQGPAPGQEFNDWKDWLEWETARREEGGDGAPAAGVDGVFICTLDDMHVEILKAIAPLNLHVMCEKPLAPSLGECIDVWETMKTASPVPEKIFAIGHVLRYSPHNIYLRKLLLQDRAIGDIVSIEHTEPVGWSHFSHSYVRGNWRRETAGKDGSLLTKCCHDIDFLLWLLCSPPADSEPGHPYHLPKSISSMGALSQFTRSRKPVAAGDATNCLSCPIATSCQYNAVKIYDDMCLSQGHTGWPVKIVCPDIEEVVRTSGVEAARQRLYKSLSEDYDSQSTPDDVIASRPWYGRCVWESDNDVCDDQVVTMQWNESKDSSRFSNLGAKTAILHMIAPTEKQCERRGRVYGTLGEVSYDSKTITVTTFSTGQTRTTQIAEPPPEEKESHGGGDYGLTRAFVKAVHAVESGGWSVQKAQVEFLGVTFEEVIRSHAMVFAAEEARREVKVIWWDEWWREKFASTDA